MGLQGIYQCRHTETVGSPNAALHHCRTLIIVNANDGSPKFTMQSTKLQSKLCALQ